MKMYETYVCKLADISPRHQHLWCYFMYSVVCCRDPFLCFHPWSALSSLEPNYDKMSSLLAVLLLLLIPASRSVNVAPQDADTFCLTDESTSGMRISDPRQVVLLDTLHYRPQMLVTLFGVSEKWISLKLLPGNAAQRVIDC